jgi:hypothetical protein
MKNTIELTLFDNLKNRKKFDALNKLEIMIDDEDNDDLTNKGVNFWERLDDQIKWGKKYKITFEEID